MSGVTFFLKGVIESKSFIEVSGVLRGKPEIKKVANICVYYQCVDGKFRRTSKQSAMVCDWVEEDKDKRIFERLDPKVKGAKEVNAFLDDLASKLNKVIRDKELAGEEVYLKDLDAILPKTTTGKTEEKKEKLPHEMSFLEFFKVFHLHNHNFDKCLLHLEAYQKHYGCILQWPDVTKSFWKKFVHFCAYEYQSPKRLKKKIKGILNSSIGQDWVCIKRVCRDARKQGTGIPFDFEDFKRPKVVKKGRKRMSITEAQLQYLREFDFTRRELYGPKDKWKKQVKNILELRDEYTFRFYTGLRISDAYKLLRPNIEYRIYPNIGPIRVINFTQLKTSSGNEVALNEICVEILKKYENAKPSALPQFKTERYNEIAKRMFRIAGFKNLVTLSRMKGDDLLVETFEECELLTSHSARHSAAGHLLENGADIYEIKEFLGQESITSTEIYAEMRKEKLHEKILNITDRKNKVGKTG